MSGTTVSKLAAAGFAATALFVATAAQAEYVCKVQEYLPLRDCPKPHCTELYRLDPYSAVEVYETIGKWYHVKVAKHGWDGFVLARFICPGVYSGEVVEEPQDDGSSY